MYDHTRQYRCTIIRGKSLKEMDDLLPIYAKIINEICPCNIEEFRKLFNKRMSLFLHKEGKTLDNHRTEIAGKLFGMYYCSPDGIIHESERTQKFLRDNDQPAFFKDICYKMQFPNATQRLETTVKQRMKDKISININAFLLKILQISLDKNLIITKNDIGYYVLNSLDVLQGVASPHEVLETIIADKNLKIERKLGTVGKNTSYDMQHINEQLNYLELANLIRITDDKRVTLNPKESEIIDLFAKRWNEKPTFDLYNYDIETIDGRQKLQQDWDYYYAKLSKEAHRFATKVTALMHQQNDFDEKFEKTVTNKFNQIDLGNEGEMIVYEYERQHLSKYGNEYVSKVVFLGKTRGIGYDIKSIFIDADGKELHCKYIEVKSTKRYTCPSINDNLWIDTLNMTRNEWIAANQHGEFYVIYRVYFTQKGITVFTLSNVAKKVKERKIDVTPLTYRIGFKNTSVDEVINIELSEVIANV